MNRSFFITFLSLFSCLTSALAQFSITPEIGASFTDFESQNSKIGAKIGASFSYQIPSTGLNFVLGTYFLQRNISPYKEVGIISRNFNGMPTYTPIDISSPFQGSSTFDPNTGKYENDYNWGVADPGVGEYVGYMISSTIQKLHYLHIPFRVQYDFRLAKHTFLNIGVGAFIDYGVGGDYQYERFTHLKDGSNTYSHISGNPFQEIAPQPNYPIESDLPYVYYYSHAYSYARKRMSWGGLVSMGVTYRQFVINFSYDRTRLDSYYKADYRKEGVAQSLNFTVGYKFQFGKEK